MTRSVLAFPKPVREEDEDYLRFIRRQGCVLHNQIQAEAHHVKTVGAGGSDYRTVPLCRSHHVQVHRFGREWFEAKYQVNLDLEQIRFLEMYLSGLKEGEDLGAK
jgi:hypothetical protein